jgi:hypothetical protein
VNPEILHILDDYIRNEPYGGALVVAVVLLLPVGAGFIYWVYRKRVHPVAVWAILAAAQFGGSQLFEENRSQKGELAVTAVIMAAVVTGVIFYLLRKQRREVEDSAG